MNRGPLGNQTYSARDSRDLKKLSSQFRNSENTFQLSPEEKRAPASRWTVRHLLAYRLLLQPKEHEVWPPALRKTHFQHCPLCTNSVSDNDPDHVSPERVNFFWVNALIGETPAGLTHSTESQLATLPGGFFWVALARVVNRRDGAMKRSYPPRHRQAVHRQGFVNSAQAIDGSSSPVPRSSSDFEPDLNFFDEDDYLLRGNEPEEVTICLIINFLQFALSYCLVQPDTGIEICARLERRNASMRIMRGTQVVAQDDGGIHRMRRLKDRGWKVENPCFALLEAKRGSTHLDYDPNTGLCTPILKREIIAQHLGEAVTTWKSARKTWIRDNIIITIAANSTFICFIQFAFGPDYMEYLDAADELAQQAILNDKGDSAVVRMTRTEWMNLETPAGRHRALCTVLALVKWQAEQLPHDAESSDDSDGDSDGTGSDMQTDED